MCNLQNQQDNQEHRHMQLFYQNSAHQQEQKYSQTEHTLVSL